MLTSVRGDLWLGRAFDVAPLIWWPFDMADLDFADFDITDFDLANFDLSSFD